MRLRAALPQALALARVSRRASRLYGTAPLDAARLARRLRMEGVMDYEEAFAQGLLDPGCPEGRRAEYLSRHRRQEAQRRHNPDSLEPFSENKLIFYAYCESLGIPTPRLYGAVGRSGGWSASTGRVVLDRDEFAAMVAHDLPEQVVVKPALGLLGLGVRLLRREGDELVDSDGLRWDPRRLYDELAADPEFDLFVVQERLRNHPALEELSGSSVLQTLRLTTFVAPDGSVRLLFAVLKLALGTGPADNYRAGTTGNGAADVEPGEGRLGPLLLPAPEGAGTIAVDTVPGTGRRIEGVAVPFFDEACEMALRAAPRFLPMRTLGWDIGLTPPGPVVVEANNYWAPSLTPMPPESRALLLGR